MVHECKILFLLLTRLLRVISNGSLEMSGQIIYCHQLCKHVFSFIVYWQYSYTIQGKTVTQKFKKTQEFNDTCDNIRWKSLVHTWPWWWWWSGMYMSCSACFAYQRWKYRFNMSVYGVYTFCKSPVIFLCIR